MGQAEDHTERHSGIDLREGILGMGSSSGLTSPKSYPVRIEQK